MIARLILVSLLVLLLGFFVGCGSSPPNLPQNTLIYGRGGDADGLDPMHTSVGESVKVLVNIFDRLIAFDEETLDLVPSLAESWETSEDGLTWTFHLRPGVKFHDGTPMNAEAVAFTFNRIIVPDHPHAYGAEVPYFSNYKNFKSVTAVDDLTLAVQLKEPSQLVLHHLAMFSSSIVSPTAVKKFKKEFNRNPVGCGPFRFVSWKSDQQLVLSAFEDHWQGKPEVDRVIFLPVKESAIRVQQLNRGEIHIADNLPPTEIDELAKNPEIKIQETPGANVGYLSMNMEKQPLDNLLVRQAICHAIDKEKLIEMVYAGQADPAVNMVPPTLWGHNDQIQDRSFDEQKAKSLLAQAAEEGKFELPLKLQLFVMAQPRPYMQRPRQTVVFIKDSLERVGFEIEIITNDIGQHFLRMSKGEHQLGLSGWSMDIPDPDNFLYTLLDQDSISNQAGNNLSRYRSEEVHKFLMSAKREADRGKRKELYFQAQEQIFQDAPVLPLVHTKVRIAQRKELSGYRLHPSSQVRLRLSKLEP